MSAGHAFLAPSSADRWGPGGCPASPRMEALFPKDTESPAAREGTAAHYYLAEALSGRTVSVGELAPNGHPVDVTMIDAAGDVLRDVRDTIGARKTGTLHIEERLSMGRHIHPQNWGTPDIFLVDYERRALFLWDYKYGHRYVDAFRNWQCLDYCVGVLESGGVTEWSGWQIVITIAQPRNYHPDGPLRSWQLTGDQLVEYARQLTHAARAAMEPDAPMVTGPHCRDCKARHACPALERAGMGLADMSMTGQPIELPPAALGLELRIIRDAIKRLEARATGLEEQALALARSGVSIPHWAAEYSKGRQRWNLPVPVLVAMGRNFGVELGKDAALTPAQAIKAGMDPDLVKEFTETPRGAMTLVPFDNRDIARRFA